MILLALPSAVLVWMFWGIGMRYQAEYGRELNWASAKALGCGIGILYHFSCWVGGVFSSNERIVRNRLKELCSDLRVMGRAAFSWYFADIKENGLVYWIDVAVVLTNIGICIDGILDFIAINGKLF